MLGELGKLRAYPDADDGLLDMIQNSLVEKVRTLGQPQAPQPQMGMDQMAGMIQGAMPQEPMSRGPIPGLNSQEIGAALERELAGQPPTG